MSAAEALGGSVAVGVVCCLSAFVQDRSSADTGCQLQHHSEPPYDRLDYTNYLQRNRTWLRFHSWPCNTFNCRAGDQLGHKGRYRDRRRYRGW